MVFQIAKAELRNLFYSPVAWFLAIVFMVMCGWTYSLPLIGFAKLQDFMLSNPIGVKDFGILTMTYMLFHSSANSLFEAALHNLYLFIPLLAMGLVSREVSSGTIKLLFSSPVKLEKIVAGKYLAIVAFNFMLIGIIGLCFLATMFAVQAADVGIMLSAALGFFLIICAYTSIGLFMSSLTNYQIIAALATFLVIFALDKVGGMWQKVEILRDVIYSIHMVGRTDRMLNGLITTKDVIYFVMVVFMFLSFTLFRLKSQREKKPMLIHVARVMAVLILTVSVSYISSRQSLTHYWDVTASKLNSISPETQNIIKGFGDEPVDVVIYTNLLHHNPKVGFAEYRNKVYTYVWEKYLRFKPNIYFTYVNYYYYDPVMDGGELEKRFPGKSMDEIAIEVAKEYQMNIHDFLPISEIQEMGFLQEENFQMVMKVKYRNRVEVLRTYPFSPEDDRMAIQAIWPNESNIAAVFKRLNSPEKIPTILFSTGNLERDIHFEGETGFYQNTINKANFESLINLGFNIDTLLLDSEEIPASTTILVVADPKKDLSEIVLDKIKNFVDSGGNLWLLGEPGKQHVLNPVLLPLGVRMLDGILVEPTFHETPEMVKPLISATAVNLSNHPFLYSYKKSLQATYKLDTPKLLMPSVAALSYSDSNDFVKKPLFLASPYSSWLKRGELVSDSAEVQYNAAEGDIRGAFPTGVQLSREWLGKHQRIIVTGDADIFSNKRKMEGAFMFNSIAHWLNYKEFSIYSAFHPASDNVINISASGAKTLMKFLVFILPSILLVGGAIMLLRRKRK